MELGKTTPKVALARVLNRPRRHLSLTEGSMRTAHRSTPREAAGFHSSSPVSGIAGCNEPRFSERLTSVLPSNGVQRRIQQAWCRTPASPTCFDRGTFGLVPYNVEAVVRLPTTTPATARAQRKTRRIFRHWWQARGISTPSSPPAWREEIADLPFRVKRTCPYGPSSESRRSLISHPVPSTLAIRSSVADSARSRAIDAGPDLRLIVQDLMRSTA